jgi:hypothetical protein
VRELSRILIGVGMVLLVSGLAAWLVGVAISEPVATGLGFLALVSLAGSAVPILVLGLAVRAAASKRAGRTELT